MRVLLLHFCRAGLVMLVMVGGRRVWICVVAMLFIESPLAAQVYAAIQSAF